MFLIIFLILLLYIFLIFRFFIGWSNINRSKEKYFPQVSVVVALRNEESEVKRLINDLAFDIKLISCPTIRENNGLAMSSRNEHLSNNEKTIAGNIYKALMNSKELIDKGERNIKVLKNNILFSLKSSKVISIDYISIANAETLEELEILSCKNVLVSIAVYIRKIRLIDNYSYSFK